MMKVILIDHKTDNIQNLSNCIKKNFPNLNISGCASTLLNGKALIIETKPDLAFIDAEVSKENEFQVLNNTLEVTFESIFTSKLNTDAVRAINLGAIGFILKPIKEEQFLSVVGNAVNKIQKKKELTIDSNKFTPLNPPGNLIGIPTIEGYDFIKIDEIIRCEGLQNCTRIITKTRTDIISSYTIGKFISMLEPFGFFSPHKSHLVNLSKVKKYHKEGTILLSDNSAIPVSKRRKSKFLKFMMVFR